MERPHTYSGFLWLPVILALVFWADWSGNLNSLQHVLDEKRTQFYERQSDTGTSSTCPLTKRVLIVSASGHGHEAKPPRLSIGSCKPKQADIVLDFDFSTPSNPLEDEVLRQALERAGKYGHSSRQIRI